MIPHLIDVPGVLESLGLSAHLGHHSEGNVIGVIIGIVVVDIDCKISPGISIEADVFHMRSSFPSSVVHIQFCVTVPTLCLLILLESIFIT